MLQTTIVIGVLAVILLLVGYFKGKGQHIAGLKQSLDMTVEILPMLALSFIVAGMAQVLIPRDIMAKWVGPESGFKGIMMGSLAGAISPGGPYVNFPIVAGFLKAGAGVATMVAFMDRLLERSELQPTILSSKSLRSNC
jgi:uncharacterized membrane protein YraQ (UPF0718 family)